MIFQFEDIDYLIRFPLAIGRLGHENIGALDFPGTSTSDSEYKWNLFPDGDDNHLKLPLLHVKTCVRLLQQCKRPSHLRVQFQEEVLSATSKDSFKADPGIRGLRSLHSVPRVEIYGLDGEHILDYSRAKWLKKKLAKTG